MDAIIGNMMGLVIGITLILGGVCCFVWLAVSVSREKSFNFNKVAAVVIGLVMTMFGTNLSLAYFNKKEVVSIEAQLASVAKQQSKKLPMMIDDETRLDSMTAAGKTMSYKYTLTQYSADQIKKGEALKHIENDMVTSQCLNKDILAMLDMDVSNHYNFFGKNGYPITTIILSKEVCARK